MSTTRRTLLTGSLVLLAAPIAAGAQHASQTLRKTARVGLLSPGDAKTRAWVVDAVRTTLHGHGWVEGHNLVIEYRYGGEEYERLRVLAKDLVSLKVDVILAASAPSARAAKEATTTIPIVFVTGNDPVRAGFVANFARPGGNMTGQAGLGPELDRKRIELLKAVFPTLSAAMLLANPTNPMTAQRLPGFEATAQALKIDVRMLGASDGRQLDAALQEIGRAGRTAGVIVLEDAILIGYRQRIIDFMAQHRVPTMYTSFGWAVEQPTKFEFVINLKTAKALGLTIPPSLLLQADKVIE